MILDILSGELFLSTMSVLRRLLLVVSGVSDRLVAVSLVVSVSRFVSSLLVVVF